MVTVPVYLRESKTTSTYLRSQLFGLPLLASLPSECTQAELYSCLLARMGRYVSVPKEGEEWWKPESDQDDDMLSDEEEEPPSTLFTLHLVNPYGNAQIGPLEGEDEETIKLTSKNYLSLDWHPRAKQKFFNEKAAEDFTQDDSWNGKIAPKKQVKFVGMEMNAL